MAGAADTFASGINSQGVTLATVPQEMLDCAAVDGAGPVARLCRVALPCRLGALAWACLVALAVALGDLAASIRVLPPGMDTLSRHIFGLLHYGVEDRVAGICLARVALFAYVAAVVVWLGPQMGTGQSASLRASLDRPENNLPLPWRERVWVRGKRCVKSGSYSSADPLQDVYP